MPCLAKVDPVWRTPTNNKAVLCCCCAYRMPSLLSSASSRIKEGRILGLASGGVERPEGSRPEVSMQWRACDRVIDGVDPKPSSSPTGTRRHFSTVSYKHLHCVEPAARATSIGEQISHGSINWQSHLPFVQAARRTKACSP